MFVFNKNYEELMSRRKFIKMKRYMNEPISDNPTPEEERERFKVFTLEFVIKKVIEFSEEKGDKRVREIAHWKIKSTENILRSLLKNNKDEIAW